MCRFVRLCVISEQLNQENGYSYGTGFLYSFDKTIRGSKLAKYF